MSFVEKRKWLHTFVFIESAGRSPANAILSMEKKVYQIPQSFLWEVEVKPLLQNTSGGGEDMGGNEG